MLVAIISICSHSFINLFEDFIYVDSFGYFYQYVCFGSARVHYLLNMHCDNVETETNQQKSHEAHKVD